MAKVFTYLVTTITVWVMLGILGITNSGSYIYSKLGFTSPAALASFQSSAVWGNLTGGLALLVGGTVLIGVITKTISPLPATATLATTTFLYILGDMIALINEVPEPWMKYVLFLILAPWTGGFVIAMWDWVRGID